MTRRTYADDEKRHALERVAAVGVTEAASECDIPKQTLSTWAKAAGIGTIRNEQMSAANEALRVKWEQRRLTMAHDIGDAANLALERVMQALDGDADTELLVERIVHDKDGARRVEVIPSPQDTKALATTMAILVDKAQLLTGAATSRTDHGAWTPERAAQVADQLAERRAKKSA